MDFRKDINGLRALSVASVVLYHLRVPGFGGGYVGVDVFFVISGFLMTQLIVGRLEQGTFSLWSFYAARARRIVPALAALNAVLLLVGYFAFVPSAYAHLGKSVAAALTFVSNVVFWQEMGYFDAPSARKWLLHTWSLSVEWQFYLVFPLFLRAVFRLQSGRWLLRGVLALLLLSLALELVLTPYKPVAAFYLLPSRAWEMAVGASVYLAPATLRFRFGRSVGLLLFGLAVAFFDEHLHFPGFWALAPVLGAALILAERAPNRLLDNPVAQFLGNISYSLYLWHWPVIVAARWLDIPFSAVNTVCLVAIATLGALGSYHFVERPWKGRTNRSRATPASLTWIAITGCGAMAFGLHGIESRVPPLVARNDAVTFDRRYRARCGDTKPCALGKSAPKHVFFWGDSHTGHLYPGLEALAESGATRGRDLLFGVQEGCLPIRGYDNTEREGCDTFNERMFELAQRSDVEAVVISSVWSSYFHGNPYQPGLPKVCRMTGSRCEETTAAQALASARIQLGADVATLSSLGKRVYLVLPTPFYDRNVALYLSKVAWSGETIQLHLTREQHLSLTHDIRALLESVARTGAAQLLDPADQLCPGSDCIFAQDGVSLYSDDNHLSSVGSRRLIPLLALPFLALQ